MGNLTYNVLNKQPVKRGKSCLFSCWSPGYPSPAELKTASVFIMSPILTCCRTPRRVSSLWLWKMKAICLQGGSSHRVFVTDVERQKTTLYYIQSMTAETKKDIFIFAVTLCASTPPHVWPSCSIMVFLWNTPFNAAGAVTVLPGRETWTLVWRSARCRRNTLKSVLTQLTPTAAEVTVKSHNERYVFRRFMLLLHILLEQTDTRAWKQQWDV